MRFEFLAKNELSATLSFFKREGCSQKILAENFAFLVKGKLVKLDKTTLSNMKRKPRDAKHIALLRALKRDFCIKIERASDLKTQDNFKFIVEVYNVDRFKIKFNEIFGERIAIRKKNGLIARIEQDKIRLFENSRYAFYDRVKDGIERHILIFKEGKNIEIQHADGIQIYGGNYRLDKTRQFILVSMYHRLSKEKEVSMQISIGQGERPQLCLGLYLGMGKAGGGCEACTVVLMADEIGELQPKCFYGEDAKSDEIPADIKTYLKDRKKNRLAVPNRIVDESTLGEWLVRKRKEIDGWLLEETAAYKEGYHMFYQRDDRLMHYRFSIFSEDRQLKARMYRREKEEDDWFEFGIGVVSRYKQILYIDLKVKMRKSFIQMEIGGESVNRFECYCGIVTGMDSYQQNMVAYPIVVVRDEVFKANEKKVMEHVERFGNNRKDKSISIQSPRQLKLENLEG